MKLVRCFGIGMQENNRKGEDMQVDDNCIISSYY